MNNILHGPALEKLKELDSESVDFCITSPPYWALRDYKTEGQLGLEPTFQEYITKLIEIFNQVKRVLKKSGSSWVNIGDTYNPEKSLCLIPQRFAIAMVDAGWICRNTIIWYKPNCMPSSARDRFTVDFEYLFFFTKSQRYYFDTQYEPLIVPNRKTGDHIGGNKYIDFVGADKYTDLRNNGYRLNPLGRIKRCVWKIPTQPFSEAHFAVFPPALVETPLKACCPEFVCRKCGKPRERIIESTVPPQPQRPNNNGKWDSYEDNIASKRIATGNHAKRDYLRSLGIENDTTPKTFKGYTECGCNAGFDGGIVLDPFIGSGTVGLVAIQNARNFIGIELSQSYIDMAMKRLEPYLLQTRLI